MLFLKRKYIGGLNCQLKFFLNSIGLVNIPMIGETLDPILRV